jgi:hypothetical protein
MLTQILNAKYGPLEDYQIKLALQMATVDIYVNRFLFHKRTSFRETLRITERCLQVLLRMEVA